MNILHVISSVNPAGGGPIEGITQLSRVLYDRGHYIHVLSLDPTDAPYVGKLPFDHTALGPNFLHYGLNFRIISWLEDHRHLFDAVIVNGIWQFHSLATRMALAGTDTPYFVFTHGMLDPWFKHAYPLKHLKKSLYWPWAEYRVLRDAAAVIFTCEEERLLARQSFGLYKATEEVVNYGTGAPPGNPEELRSVFYQSYPDLKNRKCLLYLSRIHRKKGCDLLIEAFAAVASQDSSLHLIMAGPDPSGWQAELQAMANRLGVADRITWTGMLVGDMKWGAYYAADAFVLPSHQENFGIVVAEALACSLPVLISDKVNIWREVETDGGGIVASDTLAATRKTLETWLHMDKDDKIRMRLAARNCFLSRFTIEATVDSLLRVLGKYRTCQ